MIRGFKMAAVLLVAASTAAEAQTRTPHPAAARYTMVLSRARVMRLAELCRLRPSEWVDAANSVIHDTVQEVASGVSAALKLENDAGVGAFWGGLVLAMRLAEREHQTYGQLSCDLLAGSDDLKAVDLLVGHSPAPRQAPQRRRG